MEPGTIFHEKEEYNIKVMKHSTIKIQTRIKIEVYMNFHNFHSPTNSISQHCIGNVMFEFEILQFCDNLLNQVFEIVMNKSNKCTLAIKKV